MLGLLDVIQDQREKIIGLETTITNMHTGKYPVLVVCALIFRGRRVLLERHPPSYGKEGYFWDIPGGKVECGETPEEAVVREIKEEIGIEVAVRRW